MKKLIFISGGVEEGAGAAYIEKMAEELDATFQRHDLFEILDSPAPLTSGDTWPFFSWPLSSEARQLIDQMSLGYYLLYEGSQVHESEFLELLEKDKNLLSPIDSSRDHRLHLPLLRSTISMEPKLDKKKLLEVGDNLNKMIEFSMAELRRVKRLHEKVVPMKNDNFKGVQILSKFAAGEGAGGEFFDIVKGEQEILLLLTNTTSYVASSVILSQFERLRAYKHFDKAKLELFIKNLSSELRELDLLDVKDSESLQLLLVKIDLNHMTFEGYQFGNTELISSKSHKLTSRNIPVNEQFIEQAQFFFELERGERLVISSPGVRKNCGGFIDGQKYEDFVRERIPLGARDLLNEVYFQLKKNRESDFLKHDASVIYIEVDKNVIMEV